MAKHQRSELLELLNKRYREWVHMDCPRFLAPTLDAKYLDAVTIAAACVTRVQDSDPFAGPRVTTHLLRGICPPALVLADCKVQEARRRHEPKATDPALEKAKRKVDEDRAWNQFRAKEYLEAAE